MMWSEFTEKAKAAAICKPAQKEKNVQAFMHYLDGIRVRCFPWCDRSPAWPTSFCGYDGEASPDWRSCTEDAELFAKLIISGDIPWKDHGEEVTVIDRKSKTFTQSIHYTPGC